MGHYYFFLFQHFCHTCILALFYLNACKCAFIQNCAQSIIYISYLLITGISPNIPALVSLEKSRPTFQNIPLLHVQLLCTGL